MRLQGLLPRGLTATAPRGPPGRVASGGGQRAARLLTPETPHTGAGVTRRLSGLLTRPQAAAGTLAPARGPGRKGSRRDGPGLVQGEAGAARPRTNHARAPGFGAPRDPERRATGRNGASPALGLSGSIRLGAAAATRRPRFVAGEIAPETLDAGHHLRHELARPRQ